jgi:putative ABC transport system permease protein
MFSNLFKITWRVLIRNKVFSLINVLGLAIGIAACLLIVQYISFELGYDNLHKKADRIYRIKHENHAPGSITENLPKTYSLVGFTLKSDFPEVEEQVRISKLDALVSVDQSGETPMAFNEHNIYSVDPSFLKVFSFPLKEGTVDALQELNTVVITEKTAKKYFINQNPVGKTIRIQQQESGLDFSVRVTGICEDIPANSHLQFDFLVSNNLKGGDWTYPDYYTYILLAPQTDIKSFEKKLYDFTWKYANVNGGNTSQTMGKSNLKNVTLSLQPLKSIYLYSNLPQEIKPTGNGSLVWSLGIVAFLILLLAYMNYINLSTAKAVERAKEVGIRKVLGSERKQLIFQFLFESLLVNLIALSLAIIIVQIALPGFSKLCGEPLGFSLLNHPLLLFCFFGLMLAGVIISALYPAFILSKYEPIQILKGKFHHSTKSIGLRQALVVFQFIATIFFLVGTVIVYKQLNFMMTEKKGMDVSQTLVILAPRNVRSTDQEVASFASRDSLFSMEALRSTSVESVTASSTIPGEYINYIMSYKNRDQAIISRDLRLSTFEIQPNFLKQFKSKIIAGEQFSNIQRSNKPPMILNETAVAALGFNSPKDAIGGIVETRNSRGRIFENEVIGVIEDFHQTSLKDNYTPTVFRLLDPSSVKYYELKISIANLSNTIKSLENIYKTSFSNSAFEYFFLDEFFNEQYQQEQHFGQIFSLFAGFAIFIACLGLFGLTLISVNQRVKEIGVRKVLGASVVNIWLLLSRDFVRLIIIAGVIALPLAYLGGYKWLQNYQFRVNLNVWVFVLPMITAFALAMATISYQVLKAALATPVKILKTE